MKLRVCLELVNIMRCFFLLPVSVLCFLLSASCFWVCVWGGKKEGRETRDEKGKMVNSLALPPLFSLSLSLACLCSPLLNLSYLLCLPRLFILLCSALLCSAPLFALL